ncbi:MULTISPECIES: hypothetical protein [Sporosarcina]|uniref:Uncharacterized protein n=1 Tax=Sporosarcina contaminans TaxID=633403 RepID=A0ABW3TSY9_9BACL
MRKLFKMGSSVTIDEYVSVHITGPYSLEKIGPDYAVIRSGDYILEVLGDELIIETLSEEVAILSFEVLRNFTINEVKRGAHYA